MWFQLLSLCGLVFRSFSDHVQHVWYCFIYPTLYTTENMGIMYSSVISCNLINSNVQNQIYKFCFPAVPDPKQENQHNMLLFLLLHSSLSSLSSAGSPSLLHLSLSLSPSVLVCCLITAGNKHHLDRPHQSGSIQRKGEYTWRFTHMITLVRKKTHRSTRVFWASNTS